MKQSPPDFAICSWWEQTALKPSLYRVDQARARFSVLGLRMCSLSIAQYYPFTTPDNLAIIPRHHLHVRKFQGPNNAADNQLNNQKHAPDIYLWMLFIGGFASQEFDCHEFFILYLKISVAELS